MMKNTLTGKSNWVFSSLKLEMKAYFHWIPNDYCAVLFFPFFCNYISDVEKEEDVDRILGFIFQHSSSLFES